MDSRNIETLFPELTSDQHERLKAFGVLFREWNEKINLVSRKDMDQFELHHLAHSLALCKMTQFTRGQRILDVGSGGGLPGLPLAICFPTATFHLCDSIGKKIKAVDAMIKTLELRNVNAICKRAETLESKWDFVLGRAVTALPRFISWIQKNIRAGGNPDFPNGVLYWKGTLYREELESIGVEPHQVFDIRQAIDNEYFEGKFIIHLNRQSIVNIRLETEE